MRVHFVSPVREDGGTLVVCEGAPPNAGLDWFLSGGGTLIPSATHADGNGTGSASYAPAPGSAGDTITVRVDAYA